MSSHENDARESRAMTWEPCGICWGQRRLYRAVRGGLEAETCPTCLGIGEVLREARQAPASAPRQRVADGRRPRRV